ncbi:probable receptor-like protein kinase At5g20050 [Setaria italica]|uniref:probable receptor-like protein kinase At5g20050 n=1 Tax=Setaria italica TaxID=4555 RepID=UPI000350FCE9|nr:probable receptor-like protein kinase At5g20050 [Setaria italica]
MTGDFRSMVGCSGSNEVFRGVLDGSTVVAIKRITSNKPVDEADFLREVSIIASVHHYSLVRQYLVYPFFEHGSLEWWLFNGEEWRRLLPWLARRRITVDVARALPYLHHNCHRRIVHLDIKPANIFLPFRESDANQARHRRGIESASVLGSRLRD